MSGILPESPAKIIRELMIDLALGSDTFSDDWFISVGSEPDEPDNSITLYDTAGRRQGSIQATGESQEFPGILIRVRSLSYPTGWTKANLVGNKLETQVERTTVVIGSNKYIVHEVMVASGPFAIGTESPQSKRQIFTVNLTASIRQIP